MRWRMEEGAWGHWRGSNRTSRPRRLGWGGQVGPGRLASSAVVRVGMLGTGELRRHDQGQNGGVAHVLEQYWDRILLHCQSVSTS